MCIRDKYRDKPLLEHYRRNAMARDFSWESTAREYAALYRSLKKL